MALGRRLLNNKDDGRFPAHEHISGASKTPTIIYCEQAGNFRAIGADALQEGIYEIAEDENWVDDLAYMNGESRKCQV